MLIAVACLMHLTFLSSLCELEGCVARVICLLLRRPQHVFLTLQNALRTKILSPVCVSRALQKRRMFAPHAEWQTQWHCVCSNTNEIFIV